MAIYQQQQQQQQQQQYTILTYYIRVKQVEFISADNGDCIAEFTVGEEHLNAGGTLHGGCTSTLIDCVSSYALMTTGSGAPGVSVNLDVTFLNAARSGEILKIDAKTIKAGRKLAFLAVEMSKKSDGAIVARGSHTKYIGASNFKTDD
ncbi:acyl-coenzyme A thioesterase 13-like isoform X2 [Venturia canescens]|uniref:acyl-coenzyme A thioesterase 13-like isoform X2 n=1 Tax=Venturia canescens TaxID=32260 RepID=UPI001C9D18C7|nr:acyl-coenzyme A thioesterase 13-like isoform X2 [Venturia canescens]